MTRVNTVTTSLRAALLLSVLAPTPLLAEPSLTARQMLAQAQTQAQERQANGALTRITRRLSTTQAPVVAAPEPAKPTLVATTAADPQPAPAPAVKEKIDTPIVTARLEPAIFVTTAVAPKPPERVSPVEAKAGTPQANATPPALEPTARVYTASPAPEPATPIYTALPAPPKSEAKPEVVMQEPTLAPADVAEPSPAAAAASAKDTPKVEKDAAPAPAPMRKANADKTRTAPAEVSAPQKRRRHGADFNAAGLDGQIQRIINRPEVRSMLAQYGLK